MHIHLAISGALLALANWSAGSDPYADAHQLELQQQPANETDRAGALEAQALELSARRDEAALSLIEEAVALRRERLGPSAPATLQAMFSQAYVLEDLGRLEEAEALYREVADLRAEVLGADHRETHTALNNLAFVIDARGRTEEALPFYLRVLEARRQNLGERDPETLLSLANYAVALQRLGRFDEAEPMLAEALRLRREVLGEQHPATLASLADYAAAIAEGGRLEEAKPLMADVLRLTRTNSGDNHPDTLVALANYAVVLDRLGDALEAAPIYEQALTASRATLGENHPDTLIRLHNYIYSLQRAGRLIEAEAQMVRTLPILRAQLGDRHPTTLAALSNYANMLRDLGQPVRAGELLEELRIASIEILGADHPYTLTVTSNYAAVLQEQGETERAAQLATDALEMSREKLGDRHPQTLSIQNQYAYLLYSLRRFDEAEAGYRFVLETRRDILGDDHADTLVSMRSLALVLQFGGRIGDALPLGREYIAAIRDRSNVLASSELRSSAQLGRELPNRQDSERFFADLLWENFGTQIQTEPSVAAEAFSALQLASAGATSRAVIDAAASRFAADRGFGPLVRERRLLASEWSVLEGALVDTMGQGSAGEEQRAALREGLASIEARVSEIDRQLANEAPEYFAIQRQQANDIAELRSVLDPDEAVLMLVPTIEGTHAMVITDTAVDWARSDKGEQAINLAVEDLREGLEIKAGDGFLPVFDLDLAHRLYRDLIAPVEQTMAGKRRVYVVADGALSRIPLGTLVTEAPPENADPDDPQILRDTPWLADRYALVQLPSVQSLVFIRRFAGSGESDGATYAGFGAPVLAGEARLRGARSATLEARDAANLVSKIRSGSGNPLMNPDALRQLSSLPGTRTELVEVRDALGQNDARLWLSADMTEPAIRSADLSRTSILHLATHGFTSEEAGSLAEPGLVFTPPASAEPGNDGYLAASEVVALDLASARWVILSACNTASPSGKPGETGLSGLAQAFFYAGAESLLVSHWPVFDDIAPRLTTETLRRSESGMPRAEALQTAIREIRNDPALDAAHPAVWAPFVLVGEGR